MAGFRLVERWDVHLPDGGQLIGRIIKVARRHAVQYLATDNWGHPIGGEQFDGWDEDPGGSGFLTPEDGAEALLIQFRRLNP